MLALLRLPGGMLRLVLGMWLRRRLGARLRLRTRLFEVGLRLRLRTRLFEAGLRLRTRLVEVRLRLRLRTRLFETRLRRGLRLRTVLRARASRFMRLQSGLGGLRRHALRFAVLHRLRGSR